jgi:hypothetical protein
VFVREVDYEPERGCLRPVVALMVAAVALLLALVVINATEAATVGDELPAGNPNGLSLPDTPSCRVAA